jgi:uncharacterized repeat protein (TIGR01451 family)
MSLQSRLTKRFVLLFGIAAGLGLIALMMAVPKLALATGPTPTPTPLPPDDGICHLEQGVDCEFIHLDRQALSSLIMKTNPPLDAQEVSTKTLVSVTFVNSMVADTINSDTFFVQQGDTRIAGDVAYIDAGKIAIFYPDQPLTADTAYSAMVTTGVRDVAGVSPPQDFVWEFVTFAEPTSVGGGLSATGVEIDTGMYVYLGDLHTHSGYDDTDPDHDYLPGTPAQAFDVGRANGLDFLALTGHDTKLNATRWQDILDQANAATVNGTFIGLRGFEYTNDAGHLNVLETDEFVSWTDSRYRNLVDFYAWLVDQPNGIGEFNHPGVNFNFNNFAYYGDVDQKITLREIINVNQTLLSLNKGWHVGTLLNSDTHVADWGSQKYMGVVAPGLTKANILAAIRVRRTFYVSPYGQRMAVVMQANGSWMGSAIPNTGTVNFKVTVYDPDHGGKAINLRLYDNGVRVASARFSGTTLRNWYPQVSAQLGHYYYVEAYHDGWLYPAYTSPIWVERPPTANAGAVVYAPQSGSVTLDGSASWDPDGDALAYQWQKLSGAGNLALPDYNAQVTFQASSTLGETSVINLTVTDTGGLTDADTVSVITTDKPILSIMADGPETVGPGELITYTFTITNRGVKQATWVEVNNTLPDGATYVSGSGGTLTGNIVSWTLANLAENGGTAQVQYAVTAVGGVINKDYSTTCTGCISAVGSVEVRTNMKDLYFPIIMK